MSHGQSCRGGSKSKAAPSRKEVPLMNAIHRKEELQMYCIMNDGVHSVLGSQGTVKENMFQNIIYKKFTDNVNTH